MKTVKRPWRDRVWTYGPQWHWCGWKTLWPAWCGDDEYHWKTVVFGWTVTGRVVVALWPFRRCDTAGCWEDLPDMASYPGWPIAIHEHRGFCE